MAELLQESGQSAHARSGDCYDVNMHWLSLGDAARGAFIRIHPPGEMDAPPIGMARRALLACPSASQIPQSPLLS